MKKNKKKYSFEECEAKFSEFNSNLITYRKLLLDNGFVIMSDYFESVSDWSPYSEIQKKNKELIKLIQEEINKNK